MAGAGRAWRRSPYLGGGGFGWAVRLDGVKTKTRNRIMAGVLVLMFVVVGMSAAMGR